MRPKPSHCLAFAAAATLAAFAGPADKLTFHVANGTTLARTFVSRQEVSQDEVEMLLNGQPMPAGITNAMTLIQEQRLELVDQFVAVAGGAPTEVRRTFQKVESSGEQMTENPMDAGQQDDRRHAKSELEGKTVVFERDEPDAEFRKRFDPEGPDAALLEGLVEDVDFRALLPREGSVEPDDTWKLDASTLSTLLLPGGNLSLKPTEGPPPGEGGGPDPLPQEDPADAFAGLEGEVEATYKGSRDVDGTACGVIALAFKVHSERDLEGRLPEFSHGELEIEHVKAFVALEGDGELLWDLAAGHARSFTLSGKLRNQMDVAMKVVQGDRSMAIQRKMQMSGTYELQVGFERR